MINLYLDESGSMCLKPKESKHRYFYIALIQINNKDLVKRRFKRFVSRKMKKLKSLDSKHKMFINNQFKELKGSEMNFDIQKDFMQYMCFENCISVYLIKVDNEKASSKLYADTARAFNFILKEALHDWYIKEHFADDDVFLHSDDRNVKVKARFALEEFLNTSLVTGAGCYNSFKVEYVQSENSIFVQIADVFANAYFSSEYNHNYKLILNHLAETGYIKDVFSYFCYENEIKTCMQRFCGMNK